jgi:hypothetical protein
MYTQLSRKRYLPWTVGAVALAASIVAGLWIGLTPGHSQSSQPLSPTAAGYSIFSRAAVAGDTPPTDLNEGAYTSREQQTGGDTSLRQWITAEDETLCVQISTQEAGSDAEPRACNTLANLQSSQELLVLGVGGGPATPPSLNGEGGESVTKAASHLPPTLLAGLAPDGVSQVSVTFAGGRVQTVKTEDDGFHLYTDNSTPTNLAWTADGVQHNQPL